MENTFLNVEIKVHGNFTESQIIFFFQKFEINAGNCRKIFEE